VTVPPAFAVAPVSVAESWTESPTVIDSADSFVAIVVQLLIVTFSGG
jgi:hypothetical protein